MYTFKIKTYHTHGYIINLYLNVNDLIGYLSIDGQIISPGIYSDYFKSSYSKDKCFCTGYEFNNIPAYVRAYAEDKAKNWLNFFTNCNADNMYSRAKTICKYLQSASLKAEYNSSVKIQHNTLPIAIRKPNKCSEILIPVDATGFGLNLIRLSADGIDWFYNEHLPIELKEELGIDRQTTMQEICEELFHIWTRT